MTTFTVVRRGREGEEPFSNYLLDVLADGRRVAELSHDYRGDEQWIRRPGGEWITLVDRALAGGGNKPLQLTADGMRAVQSLIAS